MHVYCITRDEGDKAPRFAGTLTDAKAELKNLCFQPELVRVELREVLTDKGGVVQMLNGDDAGIVRRTWKLSPRRALVECPNGE